MSFLAKLAHGPLTVLLQILDFCRLLLEICMGSLKMTLYKLKHKPRPDDIFIVAYPKSGTTWMQMILYQLTTDGDMDFPHINAVVQHYEEDLVGRNQPIHDRSSRRVFKTHLGYRAIPKSKAKYLYLMRNGLDVAVSYYHHYRDLRGFKGSFPQFFRLFLMGKAAYGSWFKHVAGWLSHRESLDVLFVKYEELHADFRGTVSRIADFCGLQIPEEAWPRIEERCSFAFMKRHEAQFDLSRWLRMRHEMHANRHLREGKAGAGAGQLDQQQLTLYGKVFQRVLGRYGLAEYDPAAARERR